MTVRSQERAGTGSWHSGQWGGKGRRVRPTAADGGSSLTSGLCWGLGKGFFVLSNCTIPRCDVGLFPPPCAWQEEEIRAFVRQEMNQHCGEHPPPLPWGWGLAPTAPDPSRPVSPTACGGHFPRRLDSREHSGCDSPFLPPYPTHVAPKGSRHPGVPLVLGVLEAAGTLWDPLGQGRRQRGTMRREKGWCMAEVMAQQGSPGAAGTGWCQRGLGTARVCLIKKGARGLRAWVLELGQGDLQGPGLKERRVDWRSGMEGQGQGVGWNEVGAFSPRRLGGSGQEQLPLCPGRRKKHPPGKGAWPNR